MQFFSQLVVFGTLFVLCLTNRDIHDLTLALSKCGGQDRASTLIDVSKEFINKAKTMYPNCAEDELKCGQKEKSIAFLDVALNVISEVKKGYPTCPECPKHVERPRDCSDIHRSGKNESGVYTIWPRSRIFTDESIDVYCDMDTDGGGWTVIQRRGKFSTPDDYFYKDWANYRNGFGNLKEEFWIGNDNIYAISNQAVYTIRFDLNYVGGKTGYAKYSTFRIEEENANYTLHINGFKGNVDDAMDYNNKRMFSTKDRNNNVPGYACTSRFKGGWWYGACGYSNLNGLYQPGTETEKTCSWSHWIGLSGVEIKIRT